MFERLLAEFYGSIWAIEPAKYEAIERVLLARFLGDRSTDEQIAQTVASRKSSEPRRGDRVAVMPLYGTIAQRISTMAESSGGTSTERWGRVFDSLVADPDIGTIVIDVDSPGGSVYGVGELASKIAEATRSKRIIAVANSLAASAAYWLASQASEVVVTPGGQVGSIGVFAAHRDLSEYARATGIKTTLVAAGKYKTEGNPYEPLTPEGRESMQRMVDGYYDQFVRAVAAGRGTSLSAVRNGFGEGRVVNAWLAFKEGMVDRVATLEQVLAKLGVPTALANPKADSQARPRLELRKKITEADL